MQWILLVLLYGVLKGARDIIKKKSLEKSSMKEVLFFYTLFAFILVTFDVKNAMGVEMKYMGLIAIKSFIIFVAWICAFYAIDKMPISLYGVLDLSRVLFATFLGVTVLGEALTIHQMIGLVFVLVGLSMLKFNSKKGIFGIEYGKTSDKVAPVYVICALVSCLLNAASGVFDKLLMKSVNSSQLQFWYMLYLVIFYLIYLIVTKTKIQWKTVLTNYWIYMLSILFVIADRALFLANGMADSRVTIMTLIKQSGCVVTILAGKYIFKEKNVGYKFICATVIITGIVIAVV